MPNLAVTVNGFNYRSEETDLADPNRPRFAVNGVPVEIGGFPEARDATPRGCDTAYVNTWACGPLEPGRRADAALDGHRRGDRALTRSTTAWPPGCTARPRRSWPAAAPPEGSFTGVVSDKPNHTLIAPDGKTVVDRLAGRRCSQPGQRSTGRRGYFGKRSSNLTRSHMEKRLPRVLPTIRWWRQVSQRPAFMILKRRLAVAHGSGPIAA